MRAKRLLTIGTTLAITLTGIAAAAPVPLHQHAMLTPNGEQHLIAMGFCKNNPRPAFDNYHNNFHKGAPEDAFANNPVGLTVVGFC